MTSLVIYSADYLTGKTQQTTITGVNPNAANADLQTFAQMTAALSKDTYVSVERVDKRNLDSDPKPARTFTRLVYLAKGGETQTINMSNPVINSTRDTAFYSSNTQNTIILRVSTNYGGSVPEIRDLQTTGDGGWQLISSQYGFPDSPTSSTRNLWSITIKREGFSAETVTFTLHFDETPTYAAFDLPITFNFTEE